MSAPRVGTIVHYVSYGTPGGEYESTCRAAVVTALGAEVPHGETIVSLAVLNPTGCFFNQGVRESQTDHHGGTWHYICPPRDEAHEGVIHWGGWPRQHDFTGLSSDVPSKVTCTVCQVGLA